MKKTKHTVALALAAMLACQPLSVYAATFADMNQVPWAGAEASINKAASLGLVVGETRNGKTYFRPRDSVSLSESCQLAYKLLMQTGKAKADDSVTHYECLRHPELGISCRFLLLGKRDSGYL